LPGKIRKHISLTFKNDNNNILRKEILHYFRRLPGKQISREQKEVISYLKKNPLSIFPYSFSEKYDYRNVKVFTDEKSGLKYVIMDGERLYFKRKWSEELIKGCYSFLQMEQDIDSPHRYLTDEFFVRNNDVVADIGAAEGTFALSVVKQARKIYLFESDTEWVEPLEATFAPWKEKVEIINKFVSDNNNEENITLDSYFDKKGTVDFFKIDVEGGETDLLKGCAEMLSSNNSLALAICTYHKPDDEIVFTEMLKNRGFGLSHSKGYMIFIKDNKLQPPYLRRGLIRAEKCPAGEDVNYFIKNK
jgi:precorrin-6B methylase 2